MHTKAHPQFFRNKIVNLSLGTVLATFSFQAHAADFTPDASRVVSDPSYLPQQNQVYGVTSYTYSRTDADVNNNVGARNHTYKTDTNSGTQSLAYGVTDDITIRMSDAYDWSHTRDKFTSGTNTDANADGLIDPSFGATWRVLDQNQYPVSLDLIGSYSPDWINAKTATTSEDGTVARGGQEAVIGSAISYKTKDFTVYGEGTADYFGSRDIYSNNSGTTTDYASNWQYSLAVNTQTRFSDVLSLNAGVEETFKNSARANNTTTLVSFNNSPGDVTTFNLALNYHIIPNKLVAGLTYGYDIYSNSSNGYAATPASNTSTRNETANVFGARLQYAFK